MELYEDYDPQIISEPEVSNSSQSVPDMLVSSQPGLSYLEDTITTTEESLLWPAAMGLAPPAVVSTAAATVTTNTATAAFPATVKRPCCDVVPGPFDFKIEPSRHQTDAHWVYSQVLGKVFTDMGKSVRFNVSLTDWTTSTALFIRALPVFSPNSESFEEVVRTCPTHEDKSHTLNTDCPAVKHVVRCSDPDTQYQQDPVSGRYSVVTRISAPQPGASGVPILYSFICKNSCRGGIGRRALILLFTLENHSGEILGRHQLEVRVCSCPRRDKTKQEQQYLRNHSRDQSQDLQSETKAVIQQLVASRSLPLQEVPQNQVVTECPRDSAHECDNTTLRACSNIIDTQGHQVELPWLELPVSQIHQIEVTRQVIAIMWRDAGENQVPFSEYDSLLMQIYKEGS